MCGIVGILHKSGKEVGFELLDALKMLEYRGYDSSGLAVEEPDGRLKLMKRIGKIRELEREVVTSPPKGWVGLAHTRWATHGAPSDRNSHPHSDCSGKIVLAHNGIIENYASLKEGLLARGHRFTSETDSEVVVHLLEEMAGEGGMLSALERLGTILEGSYALVVLSLNESGRLFFLRKDSPLIIGVGEDSLYLASDIPAFLAWTNRVVTLENGDYGELSRQGLRLFHGGRALARPPVEVRWNRLQAEKEGYKHFMLKEIREQPRAVSDTLTGNRFLFDEEDVARIQGAEKVHLLGCGTSYHAGLIGKLLIEAFAGIPAEVHYASEFRYAEPPMTLRHLAFAVSQSGETADTLASTRLVRERGLPVWSICNVLGSTLSRESDRTFYTYAGPEISVASTKAFTTQTALLALLAIRLAEVRKGSADKGLRRLEEALRRVPQKMAEFLDRGAASLPGLAQKYAGFRDMLFLGRTYNFPIALEGALKLKEISYIHADGYPAGEMKHGPIALVSEATPSVFLATQGRVKGKVVSNLQEVRSRKGKVIALVSEGDSSLDSLADDSIPLPVVEEEFSPLVNVLPLQLFAYHIADFLGLDVDQPRNLAKSVTVE